MQADRREQLRRTETAMLAQIARLDDRIKEEKLKQVRLFMCVSMCVC